MHTALRVLVLGSVSGKAEAVTAHVGEFKYPETAGLEIWGLALRPLPILQVPYPLEVSGGLGRSREVS